MSSAVLQEACSSIIWNTSVKISDKSTLSFIPVRWPSVPYIDSLRSAQRERLRVQRSSTSLGPRMWLRYLWRSRDVIHSDSRRLTANMWRFGREAYWTSQCRPDGRRQPRLEWHSDRMDEEGRVPRQQQCPRTSGGGPRKICVNT
jgi:hypothetical protein